MSEAGTSRLEANSGRGSGSRERMAVATTCLAIAGSCAGVAVATVVARALDTETLAPGAAGTAIGIVASCALGRRWLAARLPAELDGWFAPRRTAVILWWLAAVLAIVNTARLGLFVADPSQAWASAFPPVSSLAKHQCLPAYVRAGELAARGQPNLWNPDDYRKPQHDGPPWLPVSDMRGLIQHLGDPFEYPPTFAMAPRAAVAITHDYQIIRAAWYGISALGFWIAFVACAIWIAGRPGATALLLAPPIALSTPVVVGLQFGQAHLLVVAAAVAAMMLFARGRWLAGGLLLGFATVSKIFPGLLLVHLAVRRQWRDLAAALAAIAALIGLCALVLGPATLASFVSDQVPRITSGEAFAFTENNPDNHSLYGLAFKLATLGVEGADRQLASLLAWGWSAVALILTAVGSRGRPQPARDAMLWLGIVCLATLRSPFAPTYTAIGTLWLLAVAAGIAAPRRWLTALIAISWVLLLGAPPIHSDAWNAVQSMPAQAASIAIAVLAVWPRRTPPASAAPAAAP
jgi:hypothetical protein